MCHIVMHYGTGKVLEVPVVHCVTVLLLQTSSVVQHKAQGTFSPKVSLFQTPCP